MPSKNPDAAPAIALAAGLREHFNNVILPMWRGPGFNGALKLPYEALSAEHHLPEPAQRYRAMACARQLFVFSQAGDAAAAIAQTNQKGVSEDHPADVAHRKGS